MGDEAYDIPTGFPVRTAGKMNHATAKKEIFEEMKLNGTTRS